MDENEFMYSETFMTNVFLNLDFHEMKAMCLLNHKWYSISQDSELWKRRAYQRFPTRIDHKPTNMSWLTFVTELEMRQGHAKEFMVTLKNLGISQKKKCNIYTNQMTQKMTEWITHQQSRHLLRGDVIQLSEYRHDYDNAGRFFWDGDQVILPTPNDEYDNLIPPQFLVPTEFPITYFEQVEHDEEENYYISSDLGRHKTQLLQTLTHGDFHGTRPQTYAFFTYLTLT